MKLDFIDEIGPSIDDIPRSTELIIIKNRHELSRLQLKVFMYFHDHFFGVIDDKVVFELDIEIYWADFVYSRYLLFDIHLVPEIVRIHARTRARFNSALIIMEKPTRCSL